MTTAIAAQKLPAGRTLALGASRVAYEVKTYFRQGDSVFFTFLFPLIFLTIFSVAFSEGSFGTTASGAKVTAAEFYLPAMLAAGVLLSGLQNMSIDIATEKSDGTLKRLGGSPLPVLSYFIGKIGQVIVTGILQSALLLLVAATVFQVSLPTDPLKWLAQGMRSVFLPDSFMAAESGGTWNLGEVALVTTIWLVVGLIATRLTFRWIRKDS